MLEGPGWMCWESNRAWNREELQWRRGPGGFICPDKQLALRLWPSSSGHLYLQSIIQIECRVEKKGGLVGIGSPSNFAG